MLQIISFFAEIYTKINFLYVGFDKNVFLSLIPSRGTVCHDNTIFQALFYYLIFTLLNSYSKLIIRGIFLIKILS